MRVSRRQVIGLAVSSTCMLVGGCAPSALSSGSTLPAIKAEGWTNGGPPGDLKGNVVVLEVFATW